MKKCAFPIILLLLTAYFAFLAACGEGTVVNLSDPEKLQSNLNQVNTDAGLIAKCSENPNGANCIIVDLPSSDSQGPGDSSSSATGDGDSSSSATGDGDSSSSATGGGDGGSSSSAMPGLDCPEAEKEEILSYIDFCGWEPGNVEGGDSAKYVMTLKPGAADKGCQPGRAGKFISNAASTRSGYLYFKHNESVKTSGLYNPASLDENAQKIADTDAGKQWPRSDPDFVVEGVISCLAGSCSKPCTPLVITPAGAPVVNITKFTCPWNKLTGGLAAPSGFEGNLSIGTAAANCELEGTIANQDKVNCEGGATLGKANIRYLCGSTVSANPAACGSGDLKVEAFAKCKAGTEILKELKYKIVPNPTVTGNCAWDTKNNTFGGGVTAKVTSASTITINDSYGRCETAPSFFVSNTKKSLVSAGLEVDTWNGTAGQTMGSITIGVACGATNANTVNCPNITVKDPSAMCEYTPSLCADIALANIKTEDANNPPVGQAGASPGICYFATTITKIGNASNVTVNGKTIGDNSGHCGNTGWGQPTCASALTNANVEAMDGGYYVYIPTTGNWTAQDVELYNSYKPNLHPNCEAQK